MDELCEEGWGRKVWTRDSLIYMRILGFFEAYLVF